MAILIMNSIGSHDFISMKPVPPKAKRRLMVETRPGVDGFGVWVDATRGEVYRPMTVRDVQSHGKAMELKEDYEDLVGTTQTLTYADRTFPNVIVLDVKVEIIDIVYGVGGFVVNPQALVKANWDLLIR